METDRLSAVTAAVLADAAFDVTGEATRFSTQRYPEIIEHIRRTIAKPQHISRRARRNLGRHLLATSSRAFLDSEQAALGRAAR